MSLLLAAVMLCQTACTVGEAAVTEKENTPVSQSENIAINELRPDGKLDDDAKDVDGIALSSAEDLAKIGNDKKYPLNGNYVLVARYRTVFMKAHPHRRSLSDAQETSPVC